MGIKVSKCCFPTEFSMLASFSTNEFLREDEQSSLLNFDGLQFGRNFKVLAVF